MSKDQNPTLRSFTDDCKQRIAEFEAAKVRCGLIGPAGSGKSSLINAIVGRKIAAVGVVETTQEAQNFEHQGLIFTDLPGCGTPSWPKEGYVRRLNLVSYDCFLLVTAHRFTQNDVCLFRELENMGKPCFVIRSQFDRAVEDAAHDHGWGEAETRKVVTDDMRKNLQPSKPEKIYLTSARHPARYDLEELKEDMAQALPGMKRERFIADMAAYGEEALKKKRAVAGDLLRCFAGLAAANGLNPVPGLDMAVDFTILQQLGQKIAGVYGLTESSFEGVHRFVTPGAVPGLLAKVAQYGGKYLAEEGLVALFKQIAVRTTAKETAKWFLFVGPLIAAGIGWQSTFMLGEKMIDDAEVLAREILAGIASDTGAARLRPGSRH